MQRTYFLQHIRRGFEVSPVVAILGPRQCGKTTLARQYATEQNTPEAAYFDLENPLDLVRLEHPMLAFAPF